MVVVTGSPTLLSFGYRTKKMTKGLQEIRFSEKFHDYIQEEAERKLIIKLPSNLGSQYSVQFTVNEGGI